METQLTGIMNPELIEELQRVAQQFIGKQVRGVIQEVNGEQRSRRRRYVRR
jgi:hypothetical protein